MSEAFRVRFWMMLHGAKSAKPTLTYSNMEEIEMLDLGVLTKSEKEKRTEVALVRSFVASIATISIVITFRKPSSKLEYMARPTTALRKIYRQARAPTLVWNRPVTGKSVTLNAYIARWKPIHINPFDPSHRQVLSGRVWTQPSTRLGVPRYLNACPTGASF